MAKKGLHKAMIIEAAARLANETGIEHISLKQLAEHLHIQSPSLYNHLSGLEELKRQLMIYGWTQLEYQILQSVNKTQGYDALEAIGYTFYRYACANPGVFDAMVWYNRFQDQEMENVTQKLFSTISDITRSLGWSDDYSSHIVRTFRAFLEGFSLLVNHRAFGHPVPLEESFQLSIKILIAGMKEVAQTQEVSTQ